MNDDDEAAERCDTSPTPTPAPPAAPVGVPMRGNLVGSRSASGLMCGDCCVTTALVDAKKLLLRRKEAGCAAAAAPAIAELPGGLGPAARGLALPWLTTMPPRPAD